MPLPGRCSWTDRRHLVIEERRVRRGRRCRSQITGIVVTLQTLPGVYDVKVTNSDGQVAVLEDAFTIQ